MAKKKAAKRKRIEPIEGFGIDIGTGLLKDFGTKSPIITTEARAHELLRDFEKEHPQWGGVKVVRVTATYTWES